MYVCHITDQAIHPPAGGKSSLPAGSTPRDTQSLDAIRIYFLMENR